MNIFFPLGSSNTNWCVFGSWLTYKGSRTVTFFFNCIILTCLVVPGEFTCLWFSLNYMSTFCCCILKNWMYSSLLQLHFFYHAYGHFLTLFGWCAGVAGLFIVHKGFLIFLSIFSGLCYLKKTPACILKNGGNNRWFRTRVLKSTAAIFQRIWRTGVHLIVQTGTYLWLHWSWLLTTERDQMVKMSCFSMKWHHCLGIEL